MFARTRTRPQTLGSFPDMLVRVRCLPSDSDCCLVYYASAIRWEAPIIFMLFTRNCCTLKSAYVYVLRTPRGYIQVNCISYEPGVSVHRARRDILLPACLAIRLSALKNGIYRMEKKSCHCVPHNFCDKFGESIAIVG